MQVIEAQPCADQVGIAHIQAHIARIRSLMGDIHTAVVAIAEEFSSISKALGGADRAIDSLHAEIPSVGLPFWRGIAKVDMEHIVAQSGLEARRASAPDGQFNAEVFGAPARHG